jgi:hypothetical protein
LYLPGKWHINSTIPYKTPIIGNAADGNTSVLVSSINDGSSVILVDNKERWQIRNIMIVGEDTNRQNSIGISAVNTSNRFFISNVYIAYMNIGYDIEGWIGEAQNIWAYGCQTAFVGRRLNGVNLNVNIEGCHNGIILMKSSAVSISGCVEGNTGTGLLLDQECTGVYINVYMEKNSVHIYAGKSADERCKNIQIVGGSYASGGKGIIADHVDGFVINGGNFKGPVFATLNAAMVDFNFSPAKSKYGGWYPHPKDNSNSVRRIYNMFPNPTFNGGLRGCFERVELKNMQVKEDTSETRNGISSLKITADEGTNHNTLGLELNQQIREWARNKKLLVGAWFYIPDSSDFQGNEKARPDIYLRAEDFQSNVYRSPTQSVQWQEGGWNLIVEPLEVPDVSLSLFEVNISINRSSFIMKDVDSVYVSDVFLVEQGGSYSKLINGDYQQHHYAGHFEGTSYVGYGNTAPNDSNLNFKVGDKWVNTSPKIDQNGFVLNGWICTEEGQPGVWTPQFIKTTNL